MSPSSPHNHIRRSDSEDPKPARKRRRLEPALPVKTEDQKRMFDEWLAYQEKANSMKRALEASMRARGDAVEVSVVHKPSRITPRLIFLRTG